MNRFDGLPALSANPATQCMRYRPDIALIFRSARAKNATLVITNNFIAIYDLRLCSILFCSLFSFKPFAADRALFEPRDGKREMMVLTHHKRPREELLSRVHVKTAVEQPVTGHTAENSPWFPFGVVALSFTLDTLYDRSQIKPIPVWLVDSLASGGCLVAR